MLENLGLRHQLGRPPAHRAASAEVVSLVLALSRSCLAVYRVQQQREVPFSPPEPTMTPHIDARRERRSLADAATPLRRGGSDGTVTRTHGAATGEALLVPPRNRRSRVGRITGACPFRLTIPCSRRNHGRLAVGHTAPWPRICESEHRAGGREGRPCEGPPSPQTSAWPGPPPAGAYAAQRLYR